MPDAAIGTDLIVGFPGETARAFRVVLRVSSRRCRLRIFTCFRIRSGREPPRRSSAGEVQPAEIKRRAAVMRELGDRKRVEFARRFVGTKLKVLLEERGPDGELARLQPQLHAGVDARARDALTNREVEVEASR